MNNKVSYGSAISKLSKKDTINQATYLRNHGRYFIVLDILKRVLACGFRDLLGYTRTYLESEVSYDRVLEEKLQFYCRLTGSKTTSLKNK